VGKTVAYALSKNKELEDLTLDELKQFSDEVDEDIFAYIMVEKSVDSRNTEGGTAKDSVKKQIKSAREFIR
jgi:argininosuccinate lyase